MILLSHYFISWWFLTKKPTTFKNMSLRFSISSLKYVCFWTLVFKTILILIKFPFQRYISCRHLNFDPMYDSGRYGDFPPLWKSGMLGIVDHFVVCIKIFLEFLGPYKNVKQEFSLDSKVFTELYYRGLTIQFSNDFMANRS